jgi:putative inorganic carbon (HCO3(-)) transporter
MPRSGEVCRFMPLSAGALAGELWVARPALRAGPLVAALAAVGLGLAVGLLPLELAAWSVVGCIVVVPAFVEPLVALAALLVALPVSTLVTLEAGDFSVTTIEPLTALLVVTWLARGISRRDIRLVCSPILAALALVLLSVLASSLAAERAGLASKEMIKWFELVAVFLFTVAHLRREGRQRALLAVLLLTGAAEALYGAFQYATGQGPNAFVVGEALRAYGHFEQPNPFAGYLGTILPLGLALAATRRPPGLAVLAGLATAATAAGILLSLSRGAWIGVLLGLAAMLAAWSPAVRRWLIPSAAGLVVLLLLTASNLLPAGWSDRLVAVVENFGIFDVRTVEVTAENLAVVERMAHWQAGWYMLLDHPLLGVGAGNYPAAYEMYSLPGWREPLGHAHNYYLNMAAETGLPGAAALLVLMGVIYRTILRGLKRRPSGSFARALLVGLLGSLVVLTVHNLFDNLLVHGMPVQVGFLLGLISLAADPVDGAPYPP